MATITLDVPDAQEDRIYEAFATAFGYQEEIADPDDAGQTIDNPQSKADFAKERIASFITGTVASVEAEAAATEARVAAIDSVNQDVVIS